YKNVLPTIVIHIKQKRGPTPVGVRYSGILAYFRICGNTIFLKISIVQLQGIEHILMVQALVHYVLKPFNAHAAHTGLEVIIVVGHHIHRNKIEQTIIVYIPNIVAHREIGNMVGSLQDYLLKSAILPV